VKFVPLLEMSLTSIVKMVELSMMPYRTQPVGGTGRLCRLARRLMGAGMMTSKLTMVSTSILILFTRERFVMVIDPVLASKVIVAVVLAVPLDCWFGGTTLLRLSSGTVIEALPPAAGSSVTMVVFVELFTVNVTFPVVGSRSGLKATLPVRPVGVDEAEAVMEVVLDVGSDDDELSTELMEPGDDEDPLLAGEPPLLLPGLLEAEVELPGDAEDEEPVAEELLGEALLEPEELADAELDADAEELDGGAEEDELGEELAD